MIPQQVGDFIKRNFKYGKVVALTGAGISAESGIPTFRGKGGLWEKYDPQTYAYPEGLLSLLKTHPEKLVNFVQDFYALLLEAPANTAHLALSVLEKEGILSSVLTQNVDNLHQAAGSRNVIELHGNAFRIRCGRCEHKITLEKARLKEMVQLLKVNPCSRIRLLKVFSRYFPRCRCGGRYRIDVVLFGEELSADELSRAYQQLNNCNTLLVIGSSLLVYPAAGLPLYAKERGAKLCEINSEETALSQFCDYNIKGKVSAILPEILNLLKESSE